MFCGGSPVTGEHAWPQWIAKYIPADRLEKVKHLHTFESVDGMTEQSRGHRYPFTTEVRCVCKPCNTGWMHELETTAEDVLAPLIRGDLTSRGGRPWRLHQWRQAITATWAFKTAMMLEHTDRPERRTIPQVIFPMFAVWLRPTTTTTMWMARYVGDQPHHFGHGQLLAQVVGPEGPIETDEAKPYAGVLSVGQLAFWYVGHLVQGAAVHQPPHELAPRIARIWPVTAEAEWPPPEAVDDDGMRAFTFSLRDEFESSQ